MIRIICEPKFTESTWCRDIISGITDTAKKKRLEVSFDKEPSFCDMLAIAASNPESIAETVKKYERSGAVTVLIGTCPQGVDVCSVSTDIPHALSALTAYLRDDCGSTRTALYGVNRESVEDLSKLDSFLKSSRGKCSYGDGDGVYFNSGKLDDCFTRFYGDIAKYDSVICTNDYAAVSLVKALEESKVKIPSDIKIASFSGTRLAASCTPSVTSAEMNFFEYGKIAVELYMMVSKNPHLSTASVKVKCGIVPRATTGGIAYSGGIAATGVESVHGKCRHEAKPQFYDDSTVASLLSLGNLLSSCDAVDLEILSLLIKDMSYEEIAERLYMSANGVKYRTKRFIELCGVSGKKELSLFLAKRL